MKEGVEMTQCSNVANIVIAILLIITAAMWVTLVCYVERHYVASTTIAPSLIPSACVKTGCDTYPITMHVIDATLERICSEISKQANVKFEFVGEIPNTRLALNYDGYPLYAIVSTLASIYKSRFEVNGDTITFIKNQ